MRCDWLRWSQTWPFITITLAATVNWCSGRYSWRLFVWIEIWYLQKGINVRNNCIRKKCCFWIFSFGIKSNFILDHTPCSFTERSNIGSYSLRKQIFAIFVMVPLSSFSYFSIYSVSPSVFDPQTRVFVSVLLLFLILSAAIFSCRS